MGLTRSVRLMIVDDSIVARSLFATLLSAFPDFRIVATAGTVERALEELDRVAVDIVLLDLALPGRDGLSALPDIIAKGRGARVLIVSAAAGAGAEACVRALTLGAADTLEKPSAGYGERFRTDLLDKLRRLAHESRAPGEIASPIAQPVPVEMPPEALRPPVDGPIGCLAIGASTGGLHALSALFSALPATCRAPILITQHLPASFMSYFAAQVAEIAGRPADVARDGVPLVEGRILVAPGDAHLGLRRGSVGAVAALDRTPAASGCLPSVDPMLSAVGELFGPYGFGVVLSGMGRDGALGAADLVAAGGEVAAQDRASSVIWGMPGAAARAGLASTLAPPRAIALRIAERLRGANGRAGA